MLHERYLKLNIMCNIAILSGKKRLHNVLAPATCIPPYFSFSNTE